ncbi:hypothetical protein GF312_00900 [Candidatus Poribacteria bacterium]|nr:hypothetical protein [Candidatus Poribacteria bacterium]
MQIELIKTIEAGQNGGECLHFYDIDSDGQKELIFRQSSGLLGREDERNSPCMDDEDNLYLLCYTCFKQDGSMLWQFGKPWLKDKPYRNHGEPNLTAIFDINSDGKPELVYRHKKRIFIRDIQTTELLAEFQLPNDDVNKIVPQKVGDDFNIITLGYKQVLAYSSDFQLLWEIHGDDEYNAFRFADIDNDGKDELFIAGSLYDHDGSLIWQLDHESHVDFVNVSDINDDGELEVLYTLCGRDFLILDKDSKELFRDTSFTHPQVFLVGNFMPEVPGSQIFITEKASVGGSIMMDYKGNRLWEYPCNGYCMLASGNENQADMIIHSPSPGRMSQELQEKYLAKASSLGYEDLPIQSGDPSDPIVLSGNGKILTRFPKLESDKPVNLDECLKMWNLDVRIPGDFGLTYNIIVDDIDQDGKNEWIAHNRRKVWIFKPNEMKL